MPTDMFYASDVTNLLTPGANDYAAGYLPDPGLVDAANVALILRKPLLLTGDPGTGKTQFAHSLAWQLARRKALNVASAEVEKFETKSTSSATDLFYRFDSIRRFQAAREGERSGAQLAMSNVPFITLGALGRALFRALPPDRIPEPLRDRTLSTAPVCSVVLIDEIDKASRDFPNDLLNEIEGMYFRIPELDDIKIGGDDMLDPALRPIVIITSNSEKNLPDPFLRRCIYYNIPFPEPGRLAEILLSRVGHLSAADAKLLTEASSFFSGVRDRSSGAYRRSAAELIDWVSYMLHGGADPTQPLAAARRQAFEGLGTLVKDPADYDGVRAALTRLIGPPES